MRILLPLFAFILCVTTYTKALAQSSGGNNEFEIGIAYAAATQSDLNSWAQAVNASSAQLTSGYEYSISYSHRIASSIYAVVLRPSYFTETASGGGVTNNLTGFTFFPYLRIYPLENSFIHFFVQFGLGYGSLSGTSTYNGTVNYSASAFGASAGMGSEFCFTPSQCATVELNGRYLTFDRSVVSSGTVSTGLTGSPGHELEYNNLDVGNTMSGFQALLAYTFKF